MAIDNLVAAKDELGEGIGRALVENVDKLAKSRGFSAIKTGTTKNSNGVPWKDVASGKRWVMRTFGKGWALYNFKDIPLVKKLRCVDIRISVF